MYFRVLIFALYPTRPKTNETEAIIKLIDAGMSICRFNMSHGTVKVISLLSFDNGFPKSSYYRITQDCSKNSRKLKSSDLTEPVP